MRTLILNTIVIFILCLLSCNNQNKHKTEILEVNNNQEQITNDMKSFISLFEIPATDISRAVSFYEAVLDINIKKMEIPGMEMGIFPYEKQMIQGVIMKGKGFTPSSNGPTIYLNAGDNLQSTLDKIEKNGGKIIVSKTAHADDSGFFALFLDTEGNKLGLNSPN